MQQLLLPLVFLGRKYGVLSHAVKILTEPLHLMLAGELGKVILNVKHAQLD
jgi:hypothetical protein